MIKKILLVLVGTILPTISYAQQNSQQPTDKKTEQTQSDKHQTDAICWKEGKKYSVGFSYSENGLNPLQKRCEIVKNNCSNSKYHTEWVTVKSDSE